MPRPSQFAISGFIVLAVGCALWLAFDQNPRKTKDATVEPGVVPPTDSAADPLEAATDDYQRYAAVAAFGLLEDPAAVTARLERFKGAQSDLELFARDVLIRRLVELDRAAAFTFSRDNHRLFNTVVSRISGILGLGESDKKLIYALEDCRPIPAARAATLADALAAGDRDSVIAALDAADPAALYAYRSDYFEKLMETDPEAALAELHDIKDEAQRVRIARRIVPEYAKTEPAKAFAIAVGIGRADDNEAQSMRGWCLKRWIEADPETAKAAILTPEFPLERVYFGTVAEFLTADDADTALRWASETVANNETRIDAMGAILGVLVRDQRPEKAVAFLADPPGMKDYQLDVLVGVVFRNWVIEDETAALGWIMGQDGSARIRTLGQYLPKLAEKDAEAAFALVESASFPEADRFQLIRASASLAKYDLPRYLGLVAQLPDEETLTILADVGRRFRNDGRLEDAKMVFETLDVANPAIAKETQEMVVEMTRSDPRGAVGWAETFSDPETRRYAVRNIVDTWARADPAAAAEYARSFPTGSPESQHAAAAMADRTLARDPHDAATWLAKVEDPALRTLFLERHVTELLVLAPDLVPTLAANASEETLAEIAKESAWRDYLRGITPRK
ncbi:hypothetical protein BH23VER1_BH23VER1_09030 [soil metagenome]